MQGPQAKCQCGRVCVHTHTQLNTSQKVRDIPTWQRATFQGSSHHRSRPGIFFLLHPFDTQSALTFTVLTGRKEVTEGRQMSEKECLPPDRDSLSARWLRVLLSLFQSDAHNSL